MSAAVGRGPLAGLRVLELASIGPGPHAAMLLADLGADVVRIERPRPGLDLVAGAPDLTLRGRRSINADLKTADGQDRARRLVAVADVLLEGYRPGVAERLGLGPDDCLRINPRLVYGRVTGWGQDGPSAHRAGHDITYLATTGVLNAVGRSGDRPVPPLNLVGDYGGGSMFLVLGVLAALWEREKSGLGQVIDAAMVDGASVLAQAMWALRGVGAWTDERGANLLDGGAPFYDTYACADGRYVAVGALEEPFYAALLDGLGLDPATVPPRADRAAWPDLRRILAERFATAGRDHWAAVFADTDACVAPVRTFGEALEDPHLLARRTFTRIADVDQPAPAPRFSRTPSPPPGAPPTAGAHTDEVLLEWLGPDRPTQRR